MSYYKSLGIEKEPFSTTPDPVFFYETAAYKSLLNNLLIEVNLQRGMSVILGDVGTGKTSVGRKLIQNLSSQEEFIFHLILDPDYPDKRAFLEDLIRSLNGKLPSETPLLSENELKDTIKALLYKQKINENKNVVLIIDEAHRLSDTSLELLRTLLNYETNTHKLLQVVLLGQLELYFKLQAIPNLVDRISFKYILGPLNQDETGELIKFRLQQANYQGDRDLFTSGAVKMIYRYSQGYPSQIISLAHNALRYIASHGLKVVTKNIIKQVYAETEVNWSLEGKTRRAILQPPAARSLIRLAPGWHYAFLFLLLVLVGLNGYIVLFNNLYSQKLAGDISSHFGGSVSRMESFLAEIKDAQTKITQLFKNYEPQLLQNNNEELFDYLKELGMTQEMTQRKLTEMMELVTKMQSQNSTQNNELIERVAKLKNDFEAFNSNLYQVIPALIATRWVPTEPKGPEGTPQSGFYIIKISDGFISPSDWEDNDPGTKSAPPDCLLVVYQNDKEIFRSQVKLDTRHPVWGEEFSFNWEKEAILEVVIYDVDANENQKILSWDNRAHKEFLFKDKRLVTPQGSYLNYKVFTIPLKKE